MTKRDNLRNKISLRIKNSRQARLKTHFKAILKSSKPKENWNTNLKPKQHPSRHNSHWRKWTHEKALFLCYCSRMWCIPYIACGRGWRTILNFWSSGVNNRNQQPTCSPSLWFVSIERHGVSKWCNTRVSKLWWIAVLAHLPWKSVRKNTKHDMSHLRKAITTKGKTWFARAVGLRSKDTAWGSKSYWSWPEPSREWPPSGLVSWDLAPSGIAPRSAWTSCCSFFARLRITGPSMT
jgi:hypothetical protein